MKKVSHHLLILGLVSAMPASAAADANTDSNTNADTDSLALQDLVISADFRPSLASETPISLTTIDEETITSRNAQHIDEVLNLAPNVNVSSGASRGQYYQIRGIGERSQFNAPINPSVGLVVDGVDFSRTGGAATLFDVESVEILRGPQGTKFGTNSLAGSIILRSKEATEDFDFHAEAGLGNYGTRNLGFAVSGPLVENSLLGRLSVYSHQSDGYMDNAFLNSDDTMEQDELTLRGKLKWLASDNLTVDLSYLHLDIDNGYDAFTLDNSRTSFADAPGRDEQESDAVAIKANWQASDAVIVQSEATYMSTDIVYSYDADWGFAGQFDPSLFPYIGFSEYERKRDNYSLELRLLSDKAGRIFGGTTDWTVGLYHIDQQENFDQNSDFGIFGASAAQGDYDTRNSAIYAQLDAHLTEKLTLTGGIRFEKFDAEYQDSTALTIDTDEVLSGGKIGLNYQANQDHFLFTSLSRGYKSGGVNNDAALSNGQRKFDSEYNYSWEAGVKSKWLAGNLTTDFTVFYTDRRDAQALNSTAVGVNFVDFIDNAASATHKGIEASFDWLVTDQVRLMGSLGLLDAKFDDLNVPGSTLEGRDVAHAPNYTYSLGSEFYINQQWTFRTNVEGKDAFYFSASHDARSKSYAIFNASTEYNHGNINVSIWARNLFDKDYSTRGFFFGNNPSKSYADERYTQFGEPRVFGITLKYNY